jgi:archaellum component FlaC
MHSLFNSHFISRLSEQLAKIDKTEGIRSVSNVGPPSVSSQHSTGRKLSMDSQESLEALEVRIDLLKQDSRMCSHRIVALEDRRREIQSQVKALKALAKQISEKTNQS